MPFPRWHSDPDNVARTNRILKSMAAMFADDQDTVSMIAPLNEYGVAPPSLYWRPLTVFT